MLKELIYDIIDCYWMLDEFNIIPTVSPLTINWQFSTKYFDTILYKKP